MIWQMWRRYKAWRRRHGLARRIRQQVTYYRDENRRSRFYAQEARVKAMIARRPQHYV